MSQSLEEANNLMREVIIESFPNGLSVEDSYIEEISRSMLHTLIECSEILENNPSAEQEAKEIMRKKVVENSGLRCLMLDNQNNRQELDN